MPELSTLGSVIKAAYESEAGTGDFNAADRTKLDGIEVSATAEHYGTIDAVRKHGAVGDDDKSKAAANTLAIQAAIDEASLLSLKGGANKHAGEVYLPPGEYYVNGITMKTQVTLRGAGPSTVLRLNDDISSPLISVMNGVNHTNIKDLRLRGNKYGGGGGGDAHGIHIHTDEETDNVRDDELYKFHGDAQHRIYNVTIDAIDGAGLQLFTRACHVTDVMIADCTEFGMRIQGSDNWFLNVDINWIGGSGVFVEGGNNVFIGVKVWYIGTDVDAEKVDGFFIDSSRNLFVGCQAQDISRHGFYIFGQDYNTLIGCLADNIGNWFENTGLGEDFGPSGNQTAVYLDSRGGGVGCDFNSVQVQIGQRSGNAQLARAVVIGEDSDYNTVHVVCNPVHIRNGGPITVWHTSLLDGPHNIVYENGHRVAPINDAGNVLTDDATPSVKHVAEITLENTSATTVTALDDGRPGQEVLVKFGSANFTVDFTGTTLRGNGGADWTPASGDAMACRFDGTNWYCFTGAAAGQTASEILTAIKTVDGAASGLDADTVDGNEAAAFATAAQGAIADTAVQPADLVSTDANNDFIVPPPVWTGTETEYGALTPASGTLYFVKADA